MLTQETTVQTGEDASDGVCFFCGAYSELIIVHEMKVHGKNRLMNYEVY